MLRTKRIRSKNDCYRHGKTSKTEIKTSRLDFNVNLRTSHLWRASNKRRHDCHWLYPLCSGQKTKLYRWFWGGPDLMENTLK
jgi:hypothetical protein